MEHLDCSDSDAMMKVIELSTETATTKVNSSIGTSMGEIEPLGPEQFENRKKSHHLELSDYHASDAKIKSFDI